MLLIDYYHFIIIYYFIIFIKHNKEAKLLPPDTLLSRKMHKMRFFAPDPVGSLQRSQTP